MLATTTKKSISNVSGKVFSSSDAQLLAHQLSQELIANTSRQFSFRESKRVEQIVAPRIHSARNASELFKMRTILSSAQRDKKYRVNLQAKELAVKLFSHTFSNHRKLWLDNIICARRAWLNGSPVNYDQQDLMLICRRVARRIVARRIVARRIIVG